MRKIARSARTRSMNARQAAASGGQQELFSTQPTPGSARKLRPQTGVEDVLSNLDRCSYSALNDMDAGIHTKKRVNYTRIFSTLSKIKVFGGLRVSQALNITFLF